MALLPGGSGPQRSATEVAAIMTKQLSEDEKLLRADYVLTNDDVLPLLPQVLALHAAFGTTVA